MIFKGRILGGVQNFHHDPYLNGTTVPFDSIISIQLVYFLVITYTVVCLIITINVMTYLQYMYFFMVTVINLPFLLEQLKAP